MAVLCTRPKVDMKTIVMIEQVVPELMTDRETLSDFRVQAVDPDHSVVFKDDHEAGQRIPERFQEDRHPASLCELLDRDGRLGDASLLDHLLSSSEGPRARYLDIAIGWR